MKPHVKPRKDPPDRKIAKLSPLFIPATRAVGRDCKREREERLRRYTRWTSKFENFASIESFVCRCCGETLFDHHFASSRQQCKQHVFSLCVSLPCVRFADSECLCNEHKSARTNLVGGSGITAGKPSAPVSECTCAQFLASLMSTVMGIPVAEHELVPTVQDMESSMPLPGLV